MAKRDFTKLILMGMAAGSLIGSQSLTADEQEGGANLYENMLAAGCKGGCGGQRPSNGQNYTADNADYNNHGNYGTGSSSYYQTGSTGGASQGSSSGQGSSSTYYSPSAGQAGSSYNPSSTQPGSSYNPSSSQSGSSYYQTSPSQSNQSNRGTSTQGSGSSYNRPSSTSSNPSSSFEQQKSQQGRYLAADEG